jgi:hypothetical protein
MDSVAGKAECGDSFAGRQARALAEQNSRTACHRLIPGRLFSHDKPSDTVEPLADATRFARQGFGSFVGRFSIETFIVATGVAPAPVVHFDDPQPFPDAGHNPATNPVQLYHLGLWFNSPVDAANAGAGNGVTPFNGEHNAGAQVLSTNGFPDLAGPLKQLN